MLPAASFAEKDGTFTNSERRVQRIRKAIEPVGGSRPDWEILCDLGRRVSRRLGLRLEGQFSYTHPSEIMDEMAFLTPILKGISYDRLEREGGLQWPCPGAAHPGTQLLYEHNFPRGRAKFIGFEQQALAAELPSKRFPLILNTGRVLYHWHGGNDDAPRARGCSNGRRRCWSPFTPKTPAGPAWPTANGSASAPAAATSKAAPR